VKVLVAGDFAHAIYEPDFCHGLRENGATVAEFHAQRFFGPLPIMKRAQDKLLFGPGIVLANLALIKACRREKPDVLLCWRAAWLRPETLRAARVAGARTISLYNNDDPFGPDRDSRRWRKFRQTIPAADVCFAYREENLAEYRVAGAKSVHLLRSYFREERHHPIALTEAEQARFDCDVVFAGHCEDDERLALMDALLATELRVRIFGTSWEKFARGHRWEGLKIEPVYGDDYLRAIAGAKVALVFLSRRNRDQYTRRCFEIPAIGTPMLAPRTKVLKSLFEEETEAAFYEDAGELIAQARRLRADEALRVRMAAAARGRLARDGDDVIGRSARFLRDLGFTPSPRS